MVCPASWYAVILRSLSLSFYPYLFSPISIFSNASSKASLFTSVPLLLIVNRAASLTKFSRSAPVKPIVPRAITEKFTFSPIFISRACSYRIFSLLSISGTGIVITLSKRPGRSKALSRTSGRLVAAKTKTWLYPVVLNPSISDNS